MKDSIVLDHNTIDNRLYENYQYYYKIIEEIDYSGDRPYLTCEDVLDAHYLIADLFLKRGEGIGGFGPKDFGLLSSAVARQVTSAGGLFVYNDFWDIASSLIFGLINDHPFYDANKRTAFLCSVFFMLEHGFVPVVDIVQVEDFMVDIADFNRLNGKYMQVSDISSRLRGMFRKKDNRISYIVTFSELRQILRNYDCDLSTPSGNFINVLKAGQKVAVIGFPGWTKEVYRSAIATVRKTTGLTSDNGYDAQVFFKGADPLSVLIGEYEEPLRRLADR